ncbi:MAG: hypothetical protein ACOCTT_02835 [archaeon]
MKIQTNIRNTENPEKIKEQVKKLIPTAELTVNKGKRIIEGEGNFEDIWYKLKQLKTTKTFLEELKKNKEADKTTIDLDKLTASTGKPSIYIESATGKITLKIPWQEIEETCGETLKDK